MASVGPVWTGVDGLAVDRGTAAPLDHCTGGLERMAVVSPSLIAGGRPPPPFCRI
jgi:hypothetical protein